MDCTTKNHLLPPEIWEIIFEMIVDDPTDLTELIGLQQVCKTWQEIIKNLISRPLKWREFCSKHIPQESLCQILESMFPDLLYKSNCPILEDRTLLPDVWENVYRSWKGLQACMEVDTFVHHTWTASMMKRNKYYFGHISIWGDIMAVSFTGRFIYFFTVQDMRNPFYRYMHSNQSQFEFWYTDNRLILVSRSAHLSLKFCDVKQQTVMNSDLKSTRIFTDKNGCYSIFDGILTKLKLTPTTVECVWKISLLSIPRNMPIVYVYTDECSVHVAVNNRRTPIVVKIYNFITTVESKGKQSILLDKSNFIDSFPALNEINDASFRYTRIFRLSSKVTLAANNQSIAISIERKPWVVYNNIRKHIGGRVLKAIMHGKMCILGLSFGMVYIIRLNNINDLLNLDFATLNRKTIKLNHDDAPIINLNVMYLQHKPTLIARTCNRIHFVNLL